MKIDPFLLLFFWHDYVDFLMLSMLICLILKMIEKWACGDELKFWDPKCSCSIRRIHEVLGCFNVIFVIYVARPFEPYIICKILENFHEPPPEFHRGRRPEPLFRRLCVFLGFACMASDVYAGLSFPLVLVRLTVHASFDSLMWLPTHLVKRSVSLERFWILPYVCSILGVCIFWI